MGDDDGWQRAIDDLRRESLAHAIGISINRWEPWNALRTLGTAHIDAVQVIYNIFDQAPEDELFPLCRKLDSAMIARVRFDEGSLTGTLTMDSRWPLGDWRNKRCGGTFRSIAPSDARASLGPDSDGVVELIGCGAAPGLLWFTRWIYCEIRLRFIHHLTCGNPLSQGQNLDHAQKHFPTDDACSRVALTAACGGGGDASSDVEPREDGTAMQEAEDIAPADDDGVGEFAITLSGALTGEFTGTEVSCGQLLSAHTVMASGEHDGMRMDLLVSDETFDDGTVGKATLGNYLRSEGEGGTLTIDESGAAFEELEIGAVTITGTATC